MRGKSRGIRRDLMWSEKRSGGRDIGERGLSAEAPLHSLSKLTQEKWTWGQRFSQPHPTSCCESHKCDLKCPASNVTRFRDSIIMQPASSFKQGGSIQQQGRQSGLLLFRKEVAAADSGFFNVHITDAI